MMSTRTLIERHRAAFPGTGFAALDGERMSGTDQNRLWDMLWRVFRARNKPAQQFLEVDVFREVPFPDEKTPRARAREALRRLRGYYVGSNDPHSVWNMVA